MATRRLMLHTERPRPAPASLSFGVEWFVSNPVGICRDRLPEGGIVRLLVGCGMGSDTAVRSCTCSRTGYVVPHAEGSLPIGVILGGRYEMATKLEMGVNAAMGG